jgi:hypothetical protein
MNEKIRNIVKSIEINVLKKHNIDKIQVFFGESCVNDEKDEIYFEEGKYYSSFNGVFFSRRKHKDIKVLFCNKLTYLEIFGLTHNEKEFIRKYEFFLKEKY